MSSFRYRKPSLEELQEERRKAQERIAELKERGPEALSRYDREIASRTDHEAGVLVSIAMLRNQIRAIEREMEELQVKGPPARIDPELPPPAPAPAEPLTQSTLF